MGTGPVAASGTRERTPAANRLLLVCAGALLFALFATPAALFQTEFLHRQRLYSPFDISLLQQVAGTIGALGVLVGGRLADTHGRRPVAVVSVLGATAATMWSYLAHGWPLWFSATCGQFFLYATAPVLGVYGAELFATRSRARSAGLVAASSAVGGVCGLLAVGALAGRFGTASPDLGPALAVVAIGPALLLVLLVVAYPETAGLALEELAPQARLPAQVEDGRRQEGRRQDGRRQDGQRQEGRDEEGQDEEGRSGKVRGEKVRAEGATPGK